MAHRSPLTSAGSTGNIQAKLSVVPTQESKTEVKTHKISQEDVTFGKMLPAKGTAALFQGQFQNDSVAIKFYTDMQAPTLKNEWTALQAVSSSPFFITAKAYCEYPAMLVMEHVESGDLNHFLQKNTLTWAKRLQIANETASGLQSLFSAGYVHRDITSKNILIDQNGHVKICDLGSSFKLSESKEEISVIGTTLAFTALDYYLFSRTQLSLDKADVYSYGILLTQLAITAEQFKSYENVTPNHYYCFHKETAEKRYKKIIEIIESESKEWPDGYKELVSSCLERNPSLRPSMKEIQTQLDAIIKKENRQNNSPYFKCSIL